MPLRACVTHTTECAPRAPRLGNTFGSGDSWLVQSVHRTPRLSTQALPPAGPGTTGTARAEDAPAGGVWREAFRVERRGIDVPAGLAGAVASCMPLALGVAIGEEEIGVIACFGGLERRPRGSSRRPARTGGMGRRGRASLLPVGRGRDGRPGQRGGVDGRCVRDHRARRVPAHVRSERWADRIRHRRDLRDHERHFGGIARCRRARAVVWAGIARRRRPHGRRVRPRRSAAETGGDAAWKGARARGPTASPRGRRRRAAPRARPAARVDRGCDDAAIPAARSGARLLGPAERSGGAAAGGARQRRAGGATCGRHARRCGADRPADDREPARSGS